MTRTGKIVAWWILGGGAVATLLFVFSKKARAALPLRQDIPRQPKIVPKIVPKNTLSPSVDTVIDVRFTIKVDRTSWSGITPDSLRETFNRAWAASLLEAAATCGVVRRAAPAHPVVYKVTEVVGDVILDNLFFNYFTVISRLFVSIPRDQAPRNESLFFEPLPIQKCMEDLCLRLIESRLPEGGTLIEARRVFVGGA